jgi:hypothetical protein
VEGAADGEPAFPPLRATAAALPCINKRNAKRKGGGASSSFASPCTHVHSFSLILYIYLQQEHLDIPEASRLFGLGSTPPCALMYFFMGYLHGTTKKLGIAWHNNNGTKKINRNQQECRDLQLIRLPRQRLPAPLTSLSPSVVLRPRQACRELVRISCGASITAASPPWDPLSLEAPH